MPLAGRYTKISQNQMVVTRAVQPLTDEWLQKTRRSASCSMADTLAVGPSLHPITLRVHVVPPRLGVGDVDGSSSVRGTRSRSWTFVYRANYIVCVS
jgi:hypothetical protein